MKIQMKLIAFSLIVMIASACTSGGTKSEASDAQKVTDTGFDQIYIADTDASSVAWEGYKPTGKHNGEIEISSGELEVKDGKLTGGEFIIDMQSIVVLDLEDPDRNAKLLGHLKSADFFEAETYPTAKFVITEVRAIDGSNIDKTKEKGDIVPTHAITGNLTMKNITKSITFNAKVNMSDAKVTASTNQFYIDRAQWRVQYGSKSFFDDLKDNFINDEMGLTISLVATKSMDNASK